MFGYLRCGDRRRLHNCYWLLSLDGQETCKQHSVPHFGRDTDSAVPRAHEKVHRDSIMFMNFHMQRILTRACKTTDCALLSSHVMNIISSVHARW